MSPTIRGRLLADNLNLAELSSARNPGMRVLCSRRQTRAVVSSRTLSVGNLFRFFLRSRRMTDHRGALAVELDHNQSRLAETERAGVKAWRAWTLETRWTYVRVRNLEQKIFEAGRSLPKEISRATPNAVDDCTVGAD
jgi:hypothetical protein